MCLGVGCLCGFDVFKATAAGSRVVPSCKPMIFAHRHDLRRHRLQPRQTVSTPPVARDQDVIHRLENSLAPAMLPADGQ